MALKAGEEDQKMGGANEPQVNVKQPLHKSFVIARESLA